MSVTSTVFYAFARRSGNSILTTTTSCYWFPGSTNDFHIQAQEKREPIQSNKKVKQINLYPVEEMTKTVY